MDRRLFISNHNIAEIGIFLKRLTDPRNVAMAKDSQYAAKEGHLDAIAFNILVF